MENITKKREVRLYFNCVGTPTEYRVTEGDIELAPWLAFDDSSNKVDFELSEGFEIKSLKGQIRNGSSYESNVKLISIEYVNPYTPLRLTNTVIDNGQNRTYLESVEITLQLEGQPTHYKVGINLATEVVGDLTVPVMSDLPWVEYDSNVLTAVLEEGYNDISVMLKDSKTESSIITKTIEYEILQYFEGEFTLPANGITDVETIDLTIPPLKYNKRFAYGAKCDDSSVRIFSKLWRYVNGFEVNDSHSWHLGMPLVNPMQGRELYITDGCGTKKRFTCGNSLILKREKNQYVKRLLEGNAVATNPYIRHDELRLMMDYDSEWNYHNVDETIFNKSDINSISQGIYDLKNYMISKGYTPSFSLSQPDGNTKYMEACLINDEINSLQSIQMYGVKSELSELINVDKFCYGRQFVDVPVLSTLKTYINELHDDSVDGKHYWSEMGSHGYGDTNSSPAWLAFKAYFDWIFETYCANGDDSMWWCGTNEMYIYQAFRKHALIEKSIANDVLTVKVKLPKFRYFDRFDISLVSKALASNTTFISSTSDVYGLTSGVDADGNALFNIDLSEKRTQMADKYTSIFEDEPTALNLREANYFIQQLKPSLRTSFEDRIEVLTSAPRVLTATTPATTQNRGIKITITTEGLVSHYSISEGDSSTDWIEYNSSGEISYSFLGGSGANTISVNLKNEFGVSLAKSVSFTYTPLPFEINTPIVNDGDTTTTSTVVSVALTNVGAEVPDRMRIGESADLESVEWVTYSNTASYTLSSGIGVKTLYCQLSAAGVATSIKSVTIGLVEVPKRSASIRFGLSWNDPLIFSPNANPSLHDGVTYMTFSKNFYDADGDVMGAFDNGADAVGTYGDSSYVSVAMSMDGATDRAYPDTFYNSKFVGLSSNKDAYFGVKLKNLEAGTYEVKLYLYSASTNSKNFDLMVNDTEYLDLQTNTYILNGGEITFNTEVSVVDSIIVKIRQRTSIFTSIGIPLISIKKL